MKNSKLSSTKLSQISKSDIHLNGQDYHKNLSELMKIKYPTHPIDQATDLNSKMKSLKSENVRKQMQKIADNNSLNCYRRVRGDGNCFFRAIAFQYIACLNSVNVSRVFSFLDKVSLSCCYPQSIPKYFQKYYDGKFLEKVLTEQWQKRVGEFTKNNLLDRKSLIKMFDTYPLLDFITMLYFRGVCLKSLEENRNSQIQEYLCGSEQKTIRTYSEETEGIVLHLCSKILSINIHVFEIRVNQVMKYRYTCEKQPLFQIFLLFQDSHYDILENYADIQSEKSALKSKEFYGEVNEKLIQGQCIECLKKGDIYEDNGLCIRCYEQSLNNLVDITTKDVFITQRCSQCMRIKNNVSQIYGMCQSCLQIQKRTMKKSGVPFLHKQSSNSSIHSTSSLRHYGKCAICRQHDYLNPENGICNYCLQVNKNASNFYFNEKEKINQREQQKKMLKTKEKDQYNQKGICRKCQYTEMIDENSKLCQSCNEPEKKPDNIGSSYDSYRCKKCKQLKMNQGSLKNGLCMKCQSNHTSTIKQKQDPQYQRWLKQGKN